ncbi:MAG: polysaccharide biosynthesis/export family protein [Fluviicoccus sp.]|uniref:polysaccharide biosynthesis/export family protein n=1 Tax=Fluviicoccus sp. TaxID=2003552 RepID=UPI00271F8D10|nr:polysaccharide biosynthesis/export family protein [Fluviicoccus sp.]MDO8329926.1 polysaccharide biosynthesis/export family protein [Fluviicoccus sp.]
MTGLWRWVLPLVAFAWANAHAGFLDGLFGGRDQAAAYGQSPGKQNARPPLAAPLSPSSVVLAPSRLSDYRLGPGDRVQVTVFNEKELSMEMRLSDAGSFLYPFIGEIVAKGMTIGDLQQLLVDKLSDGYLVGPKVYVSILEYRPFFVNGEVTKPGGYSYQAGLTVRKAISLAGGLTARASLSKIFLIHEDDPLGQPLPASLNDVLRPGDILTIDQSFF